MATIATMTNDGDARTDASSPSTPPEPAPARTQPQPAQTHDPATASRPLLVPVLTTVTATLIAGVFLLALAGFNILRDDMSTLRDDMSILRDDTTTQIDALRTEMKTEIDTLRTEMKTEIGTLRTEMNDGFERVGSVLLDHTDRLARIETHLDINPADEPTSTPQP